MIKYDIYRGKNSNEIFFRNGFYLYLFKLKICIIKYINKNMYNNM